MQEEYSLLRQENFQLKNQISELKNAFDLNRDILKIISQQSKSSQPRIQMLYQIINRLTSINNQIMINTAELIHQKNTHKFQKESLKRQNELLKERIDEMLEKEYIMNKTNKINELSVYFKNKLSEMENQMKALEEDRIIKEHQIQFLTKKLQIEATQYYEAEQKKISLIPTIDKNNPPRKFLEPHTSTLTPPLQHARKYSSNKQIKLEIKLQILKKQFHNLKIYSQELQYRLLALVKFLGHQDDIKKKETNNVKKQHRKCLEEQYSQQMAEVRLLKFALNNLVKKESQEGKDYLFTLTRRGPINNPQGTKYTSEDTRANYLYKSIQKDNRVKMKPTLLQTQNDENEQ